ncbi:c-type cytochrome [Congregibacter litoralis]|uniref:Cytochrome c5 n=1 Tax=Congregibacter litoralis KT71 TaxID=314285 RepID=A4A7K7_9GAMM|nr:c-type cytochrome [Congregibacter litoralis]EAQ98276.2 Cytochrome c5 [Congregibacter litoralis KT71]
MRNLLNQCRGAVIAAASFSCLVASTATLAADNERFGYGSPATAEQIAGWDIDVRADGQGLPPGEGSVEDGEWLYEEKCALCHGSFGESVGGYPALAGGEGSLTDPRPKKTVGSYWRYTSTLWDYIHRAMPFTQPESLSDDEVYAITAYVLHLNDIVDYDFVLTRDNLTDVHLPNENNFIPDQRPDTRNKRCMKRCKDPADVKVASEAAAYIPEGGPDALYSEAEALDDGLVTTVTGGGVYERHCALCHAEGIGGAPMLGDAGAWAGRIEQGVDVLYRHAIEGYTGEDGIMPPKGGFVNLPDNEVSLAVDYIVEQSQ